MKADRNNLRNFGTLFALSTRRLISFREGAEPTEHSVSKVEHFFFFSFPEVNVVGKHDSNTTNHE